MISPRLQTDLVELMLAAIEPGGLTDFGPVEVSDDVAVCVVLAAPGYPEDPQVGAVISGLETSAEGVTDFHAGTKRNIDGSLVTSGGRVLSVVGRGSTFVGASIRAYSRVNDIDFNGLQYRGDIALNADSKGK